MNRVKPDVAAERAVLAGVAQYGIQALTDVSDIIEINCFSVPSNQSIYRCLEKVLENSDSVDFPSLQSSAKGLGLDTIFEKKADLDFVAALFKTPIKLENVRNLAVKLRKLDIARKAQDRLQQAFEDMSDITGNESIDSILSIAETPLFDLTSQLNKESDERPKKLFVDGENYLDYLAEHPVTQMGVPTGFTLYDLAIGGGIRRGSVHFIVARPKVGKSTCAKQFSVNISLTGVPVLLLDTEMQQTDVFHRAIAGETDATINEVETGKFADKPIKEKMYEWVKRNKDLPIFYKNIAGKPFEEILSIIRRWLMMEVGTDENGEFKNCVVIYDYFKLMDQGDLEKMQEYQAIGFQLQSLINFCVKHKVACHAFVQSNREGIIRDASDIVSQSDRILWFAGSLCLLRKSSPEEMAENPMAGNTIIKPLDTRFGSLDDGDYIHFNFVHKKSQLKELNTHSWFVVRKKNNADIEVEPVEEDDDDDSDSE